MAGFQGIAERLPRGVTIYLLPGLTGRQRRAVIRRLRQEASRGCGPELPLPQLVIALLLDRLRGALGLAASALRLHPGTTLLPAAFVGVVLTLFVLASGGVGSVPAPRPALAAAQSTTGPAPAPRSPSGAASGLVAAGGGSRGGSRAGSVGGTGAGGIRPSSVGAGGRGLGSGQPAPGTRSAGRPKAARVCFGAMPGVAATHSPLACHRTSS